MEEEMAKERMSTGDRFLSLDDQLYWILFLEACNMVTTPSYPRRLLKKAQAKMHAFYSTVTRPGDSR
jgi:hypothetical protein